MELNWIRKNKFKMFMLPLAFLGQNSWASTALMVSGHAGVVGQYSVSQDDETTFAFRVPVGLTLQASPSDNANIYLGLEYAYNNFPGHSNILGETTTSSSGSSQLTPMPFSGTTNEANTFNLFSERADVPTLTQAYVTYQTPLGLIKAGRMPRNWGLGLWYNDQWTPTSGSISTSDAIAVTSDVSLFDVSLYMEKVGTAGSLNTSGDTARAYSAEVRLKSDPTDAPSSGVSREIGVAYSTFKHDASDTDITTFDLYTKLYFSRFFLGAEVLYPSGSTKNPNYLPLGGAPSSASSGGTFTTGPTSTYSQQFSAMAALFRFRILLSGSENSSIYGSEKAQKLAGTADREESHTAELYIGYASGGENQFYKFDDHDLNSDSNKITAIMMNYNIQPAFLMFNNMQTPVKGMPTGAVTNTTFIRASYSYETPGFGTLEPALIYARLNKTNPSYSTCTPSINPYPLANPCVGGSHDLGTEVDFSYHYTTKDRVTAGLDLAYWFTGDAWKKSDSTTSMKGAYGLRAYAGTDF